MGAAAARSLCVGGGWGTEGGMKKEILTFKNKERERDRNGGSVERGVMENGIAEHALN